MITNHRHFLFAQAFGLVQNGVRDAHLADVVKKGATANIRQRLTVDSHFNSHLDREVNDAF